MNWEEVVWDVVNLANPVMVVTVELHGTRCCFRRSRKDRLGSRRKAQFEASMSVLQDCCGHPLKKRLD